MTKFIEVDGRYYNLSLLRVIRKSMSNTNIAEKYAEGADPDSPVYYTIVLEFDPKDFHEIFFKTQVERDNAFENLINH